MVMQTISTGYPQIDKKLGSVGLGQVTVLGFFSKHEKRALGLSIAEKVAANSNTVAFVSYESEIKGIASTVAQAVDIAADITADDIARSRKMVMKWIKEGQVPEKTPEEIEDFAREFAELGAEFRQVLSDGCNHLKEIKDLPLHVINAAKSKDNNDAGLTDKQVKDELRKVIADAATNNEPKLGLVIINQRNDATSEELQEALPEYKRLAEKAGVHIMVLAMLDENEDYFRKLTEQTNAALIIKKAEEDISAENRIEIPNGSVYVAVAHRNCTNEDED